MAGKVVVTEQAKWTVRETNLFIELMVDEVKKGNRPTSTFTKSAWKTIQESFIQRTGHNYVHQQFKNKYGKLRTEYREIKKLIEQTGFAWNPVTKTVIADDECWNKYIAANQNAAKYRKSGCSYWVELQLLFYGDTTITGEGALGHSEDAADSDGPVADLGSQTNDVIGGVEINSESDEKPPPHKHEGTASAIRSGRRINSSFEEACKAFIELSKARLATLTGSSSVISQQRDDPYSIAKCMEIMNALEGLSVAQYVAGLKLLQDPGWRETFMLMPLERRLQLLEAMSKS